MNIMTVIFIADGQRQQLRVHTANANYAGDAVRAIYPQAEIKAILAVSKRRK
jgi:hypothetical protein